MINQYFKYYLISKRILQKLEPGKWLKDQFKQQLSFLLTGVSEMLYDLTELLIKFLNQVATWYWQALQNVSQAVSKDLESLGLWVFKRLIFLFNDFKNLGNKVCSQLSVLIARRVKPPLIVARRRVKRFIYLAREGRLSWFYLFKLAFNNLAYSKSRTLVTTGAIAMGTGAIVFLVSFAYGLQGVVTQRLIYENATKISDVQSSSTALNLDQESVMEIEQIGGVKDVAKSISLAGKISYNNSKTDVVIVGAQNNFLEYANMRPIAGSLFSDEANQEYTAHQNQLEQLQAMVDQSQGDVLGTQDEPELEIGQLVQDKTWRFRVKDDTYLPLRAQPTQDAQVLGYVKGSILETHPGQLVWGSTYESVDTKGKFIQDSDGQWYGQWLKTEVPLYEEIAATVYRPVADEAGTQIKRLGYLPQVNTHMLSPSEMMVEKQLEQVMAEQNRNPQVLGEATASAQSTTSAQVIASESAQASLAQSQAATAAASLQELVSGESKTEEDEESLQNQFALVEVAKKTGKEVIVSTGLLDLWELDPEAVTKEKMDLEYILSGGVIPGLSGRVMSKPVSYQVVGVIQDDRALVFAPLADLQSMGARQYTSLKVLAKSQEVLDQVRTHIETLGFTTQSLVDTLLQVQKLFAIMRFLLGLFGMIALVVAVFGMFNTLTISLLERTREIGVMKTLGTTDSDVLKLFLVESFQIGVLGGVLGVSLGMLLGSGVDLVFSLFKGDGINLFQTPFGFMIFVFVLSVVVGLITGLYPSNRARKISALDALRYE